MSAELEGKLAPWWRLLQKAGNDAAREACRAAILSLLRAEWPAMRITWGGLPGSGALDEQRPRPGERGQGDREPVMATGGGSLQKIMEERGA